MESRMVEDFGLAGLYDQDEEVEMVDPPTNEGAESQVEHKCFSAYPWEEDMQLGSLKVKHVSMDEYTIEECTELLLCELRTQEPKCISVACYHIFIATHSLQEIIDQLGIVAAAARGTPQHKIVFASMVFIPQQHKSWSDLCKLNFEIRRLCCSLQRPSIPLHKVALLVQTDRQCAVKKACFADAISGQNLGSQFTMETLSKLKLWVLKYHVSGFAEDAPIGWRMTVWDLKPVALQLTVGYRNPTMIGFLREQGAYREESGRRVSGRKSAASATSQRGGDNRSRELRVRPAGVREARRIARGGVSRGGVSRGGVSRGGVSRGVHSRRGGSSGGFSSSGNSSGGSSSGGSSRGRNPSSGSYSSYTTARTDSSGSYRSSVSTDSVFADNSEAGTHHGGQLVAELEALRLSRSRMERDGERRVDRERERNGRLEAALERTRNELAELKRDYHNLKLDNERLHFNHQEAWTIIRSEWKRRDDEQERRERKK